MTFFLRILLYKFFLIYMCYKYSNFLITPVEKKNIPLITNKFECTRDRFYKNDGLIIPNQDKVIYDTIRKTSDPIKPRDFVSEEIMQDFSHNQIFDIIEYVRKSECYLE